MACTDQPFTSESAAHPSLTAAPLTGLLHIYVAFDWGEEIALEPACELVRGEAASLPQHGQTLPSMLNRPPPLRVSLDPALLALPELGRVKAAGEAMIFDFGAVSVALQVPFHLSAAALSRLAGYLAEPGDVVQTTRTVLGNLYQKLLPAIREPVWSALSEEYIVFQLTSDERFPAAGLLDGSSAEWLAGLVLLEAGPLSDEAIAKALDTRLIYSPTDLFIPNWAAAVLIDRDCDETLRTIEFANLQLLKFRHVDHHLNDNLSVANGFFRPAPRQWRPIRGSPAKSLRAVGELKVEAQALFERASNILILKGISTWPRCIAWWRIGSTSKRGSGAFSAGWK